MQFNPETLKVSFANQIQTPSGTGDQKGTPARQFVGDGYDEACGAALVRRYGAGRRREHD